MTRLSVNINKIALLRNARGKNNPDVIQTALDCERFGAQGITVHPRPDQRHIRYEDVLNLKPIINTELNIEGYPSKIFMDLVLKVLPRQVTLVPDPPEAITSSAGWDTISNQTFLTEVISELKKNGIRTSIFIDTDLKYFEPAAKTGTDRVELYTENFATHFQTPLRETVTLLYKTASVLAQSYGIELNAGHDLDLYNLRYFIMNVPYIEEVSIGHALICDSLYMGLENTIQRYLYQLRK